MHGLCMNYSMFSTTRCVKTISDVALNEQVWQSSKLLKDKDKIYIVKLKI